VLASTTAFAAFAAGAVHWTYEGEEGPQHWGSLSPDYAACASGLEQSPIDIPANAPVNAADIIFDYKPSPLTIVNNGHAIKVEYPEGSSITIEGETYALVQFHFHASSEHTRAGAFSDMEVHFVNQSADGKLAVVGAFMQPDAANAENAAYQPVFVNMPATVGDPAAVAGVTINAADMLPAERTYYRSDGSLTTPPCSEGVKWFVLANPVQLSTGQIDAYEALYSHTNRPVQPMGNRVFYVMGQPVVLPVTGGFIFPVAGMLTGSGMLIVAVGLYLRRKPAARSA